MRALLTCLIAISALVPGSALAHEEEPVEPFVVDDGTVLEVTLGGTQLFAPDSLANELRDVVPTATAMFVVEWFLHYRWHPTLWFNLPTAPRISFEGDEPKQEYVPPALALGIIWVPLTIPFSKNRHRFEMHIGAFGGATLSLSGNLFGIMAVRAYLLHESDFGLFVGAAAAPRLDTAALIYGIGYRF